MVVFFLVGNEKTNNQYPPIALGLLSCISIFLPNNFNTTLHRCIFLSGKTLAIEHAPFDNAHHSHP